MSAEMDPRSGEEGSRQQRPQISLPEAVRNFTEEFALMVGAGLPVLRSLHIAANVEPNAELKVILEKVAVDVEGGSSLCEALRPHANAFSPSYVTMVKAGEIGGVLDIAYSRIVEKLEWDRKVETTRTPEYTSVAVRRFANSLGHYIGLGVPILEAINLAKEGQDEKFGEAVKLVHDAIREGESMAGAMQKSPDVFDSVFIQFVDIGEETGELDKQLLRFAKRTPDLD